MVDQQGTPWDNRLLQQASDFFAEFSQPEHWNSLLQSTSQLLFGNVFSTGLMLLLFLFGFMSYQRLIWYSDRMIKHANRDGFISSRNSFHLLVASSISSLLCWTPLLLMGAGLYFFTGPAASPDFQKAFGLGLMTVYFVGAGYHLLQEFFSKGGLSETLYGFKYPTARYLVHRLDMIVYLATPLIFLIAFSKAFQDGKWYDSVGRISFLLLVGLGFTQFHKLFWPTSKLYQRLSNDGATLDSGWMRHRILVYLIGCTAFCLSTGLTLGGWLEHASELAINFSLSALSALLIFALKAITAKQAGEWIRRANLIDDFGRSPENPATLRSPRVQQFVARNSQIAQRGVSFLGVVLVAASNYWIWRNWISLPPELVNLQIGGLALSGILIGAKLLCVALITYFVAKELPPFALWCFNHQTRISIRNPILAEKLFRCAIGYSGLCLSLKILDIELPVIPWLGTLLLASVLFAGRQLIADGLAGLQLLFDGRIVPNDCIEVEGRFGRVAVVNWLSTTVEDNLGTRLIIPNSTLLSKSVVKSRNDEVMPLIIDVTLPRQADAFQAQAVMMTVAQRDPAIINEPPPHVRFLGFRMTEIRFQIQMLVLATEAVEETRTRIEQKLEMEFERHEIFQSQIELRTYHQRQQSNLFAERAG
jgi:small-conductance mechanosensitive channel